MYTIPRSPATALPASGPTAPVKHAHHPPRRIVAAITIVVLVTVAAAPLLLAFATASPAKAATMIIPGPARSTLPSQVPAPIHTVVAVAGGMPGWQIALIAAGAAVLAAVLAVAADRARTARRPAPAPSP